MISQWSFFGHRPAPSVPGDREDSTEQGAGFLSRLTFAWMSPLMKRGYKRRLELNDIWLIPSDRAVERLHDELRANFRKRLASKASNPLVWALYDTFQFDFWFGGLCQLLAALLQVMAPFTLRFLVAFSKESYDASKNGGRGPSVAVGVAYVLGIAVMQIILSFGLSHFNYRSMLLGGESRSVLIALMMYKSLKLSTRARAGSQPGEECNMVVTGGDGSHVVVPWRTDSLGWSNGRIMNLISTDASRVQQACDVFHLVWTSPIQIILTVALLLVNLGYSALAGVAILVTGLAILTRVMRYFMARRSAINVQTDKRVSQTQEMLQGIRFVKYFSLESFFLSSLKPVRARETKALLSMHITKSAIEAGSMALPIFSNMAAFIVYSFVSHRLEPATVFSSLALFNGLRTPMNWLPVAIGFVADAATSIKRMEDFFLAEESSPTSVPDPSMDCAIRMDEATFTWEEIALSSDDGQNGTLQSPMPTKAQTGDRASNLPQLMIHSDEPNAVFSLKPLSLDVGRAELIAVIGNVGCGKSSLLSALAGEMRQTGGQLSFGGDRGFCPQHAWIQNATIRENIIFGRAYDASRYKEVVEACALLPDFATLSGGDLAEIGERGITLSGGQKQRINIARAIYSDADIVILDDPLSAVDAHVGKHIFDQAIRGLLKHKCRVMATHQIHLVAQCDRVVWMVDGQVIAIGTYQELFKSNSDFRNLLEAVGPRDNKGTPDGEQVVISTVQSKSPSDIDEVTEKLDEPKELMQEDVVIVDSVPWSVYGAWIRSSGGLAGGSVNALLIIISHACFRVAHMLTSLALTWWVSGSYNLSKGQYIAIYASLGVLQSILFLAFSVITCDAGTRSSQAMSNQAMWRILRAPIDFFDTTPLGRIIHRFTKDVDTMDNILTDSVRQYIVVISSLASVFILIVVYFPPFTVALVVSGVALFFCVSYYRSSARELKRHHATLDGAVFARFSETLIGASCIHAYGREQQFLDRLHKSIDDMDGAYFLTFANQQWLSLRLDNVGNLLSFATGLLVVIARFNVDPSIGGLVLTFSLSVVGIIQMGIKYLVQVDNSMTSTERLHQYATSIPQEAALETEANLIASSWPDQGSIKYEDVYMRYRPDLPLVIQGFNLEIRGGERIGVVGRTGAGKSTILSTLFRLTELSGGRITIDGINIAHVGLQDLRNRLAIIPQDPTLFRGTVRSNLDPLNKHTDMELWNALRQAHVRVGLDSPVEEEGLNFSLGQRQLLALARAVLRDARIVLIDEGTSSVDPETDTLVQDTLEHNMHGKTLIAIAHRLRTVLLYDRICVMDKGRIKELGSPLDLWDSGGIFRSMCDRSQITRDMFIRKSTL